MSEETEAGPIDAGAFVVALSLPTLFVAPSAAQRVCVEELAGTCLKFAGPPAASTAEHALGLWQEGRRRAQAMVGVSCHFTACGTPFTMKLNAGGCACASHIEGEAMIDRKIDGDRLCFFGEMVRNESCVALPESGRDGRSMLQSKAGKLCPQFKMPPCPPGRL